MIFKRPTIFFFVVFSLLNLQPAFCAGYSWDFEIDPQGWTAQSQIIDFAAKDGMLVGKSIGPMPYFVSPFPLNINSEEFKVLVLEMETESEYHDAMVLWRTSSYSTFGMEQSDRFSVGSRNKSHKYYIDLSKNERWTGIVQQLLIIPMNGPGQFRIRSIGLERKNMFNSIISKWQEFTAYEPIKGVTVNTIASTTINKQPINYYVIVLLIIIMLTAFGARIYKVGLSAENTMSSYRYALVVGAIFLISSWCFIEARMWLDYHKTFLIDLKTYGGKTLEERRAALLPLDLYDFIKFCNNALPPRSRVNFIGDVYFQRRSLMYLYPNVVAWDDIRPEFVIVFLQDIDRTAYSDYDVFATFKDKEYILKRRTK